MLTACCVSLLYVIANVFIIPYRKMGIRLLRQDETSSRTHTAPNFRFAMALVLGGGKRERERQMDKCHAFLIKTMRS